MSSDSSSAEIDRLRKIKQLKKRIVGIYGSGLLTVPWNTEPLQPILTSDSAEVKAKKIKDNKQILEDRAQELKDREPELIAELEKLIERIKTARQDYGQIENLYASSNAALSVQKFKCEQCGNQDINLIIMDPLRGDSICNGIDGLGCGHVITDHMVEMGAEKRNFEGEEDRNHFGPAPNKLMPDVVNMETSLNIHLNGREKSEWKRLSQTHQTVEMNLSTIGKNEKHTREGYKTQQKRKAFALMEEIAANINIHQVVVMKAKEEFTKYRDIRDALHQFEGVVSACLVLAYEELSLVMTLDEVTKSVIITSDIGRLENETNTPSVIITDVSITTVPDVVLAKFTLDQVVEWLLTVAKDDKTTSNGTASGANGAPSAANIAESGKSVESVVDIEARKVRVELVEKIVTHVKSELERQKKQIQGQVSNAAANGNSRKRRLLDSRNDNIFGTVTVSSRLNRYKGSSSGGSSTTGATADSSAGDVHGLSAGQILLRTNLTQLLLSSSLTSPTSTSTSSATPTTSVQNQLQQLSQSNITSTSSPDSHNSHIQQSIQYFRDAISRRTAHDIYRSEKDRVAEIQTKRLRTELSAGLISKNPTIIVSTVTAAAATTSATATASRLGAMDVVSDEAHSSTTATSSAASLGNSTIAANKGTGGGGDGRVITGDGVADGDGGDNDTDGLLDFDLEDFVGGPVLSASAAAARSQFNNSNIVNNSSSASASSSVVGSGGNKHAAAASVAVKRESGVGAVGGMKNGISVVKTEVASVAGAGSMKPFGGATTAGVMAGANGGDVSGTAAATGAAATTSGTAAAAAAGTATGVKKIGIKPRPKFVIR